MYTKRKSNKYLRQAHYILAIYCRAENNRIYNAKGINLRPGYLGKWIEFNITNNKPFVKKPNNMADHQQNVENVKKVRQNRRMEKRDESSDSQIDEFSRESARRRANKK